MARIWNGGLGARESAANHSSAFSAALRNSLEIAPTSARLQRALHSERQGALHNATPASARRNVLVDPEHIRRIVLLLDRREARELVGRKRRSHPLRRLALADVVEVDAARRKRPRRARRRPGPRNVSLGVVWVGPTRDDHEIIIRIALIERRRLARDATHCAAELLDQESAQR